ncbi:MmgE/PrpD family protein [Pigmentiphaga litoralis]|uniref:MmgE/PrpD family protein n=1 Tax=Pigmentiphaga litoralis TaxID=516702 RepID=UPI0016770B00|nr:MmgE/PrpD family protein [Pigmentiphaga litoralis]GGX22860.1 MmgE/PrpD family protein [Pigmentiphaga litoralis]
MNGAQEHARNDALLAALAAYTANVSGTLTEATCDDVCNAVTDTLAVALGALRHPAVGPAQRYARNHPLANGATLWGTHQKTTVETAALVNGVPLRGYDYNDLYMGKKSGGHPSDIIPGLIALAEVRSVSGADLFTAIAVGYEVNMMVLDAIDIHTTRWDYPVLTAIGATCGAARLLSLSETQTAEAVAIAVISHFVTDEVESGDLNARGDLTMWKRFNGSHAVRHGIYAALLAEAGVEGAVRPFEGRSGFLSNVTTSPDAIADLEERLQTRTAPARIRETQFKRWPVGSRGQSAIQAALHARATVAAPSQVKEIRVTCDQEVYEHLLARRADPWHPISRETADHSLPYIVAAAVLDGTIDTDSFAMERVTDPARQAFLNATVKVTASQTLSQGASGGFLASVELIDDAGRLHVGDAAAPPGHARQRFTRSDLDAKFAENVAPVLGGAHSAKIHEAILGLADASSVRELTALLAQEPIAITPKVGA